MRILAVRKCITTISPHIHGNETIKHLLFDYQNAKKNIRRIVTVATGLPSPRYVYHMLGNWLAWINLDERKTILVRVAAYVGLYGVVEMM